MTDAPGIFDLSFRVIAQYRPFELVAPGFEEVDLSEAVVVRSLTQTDRGPVAPFAAAELSVAVADEADVVTGLFSASGDHVAAVFSPVRGQVGIEVRRNGYRHVVALCPVELRAPFRAAFAVCENQVTALADTGAGWRPVLTNRDRVADLVDLRDPDTLSAFRYGYAAVGSAGEVRLSGVKAGAFGMVGLRDPHLVQRPDGSAYVRDNLVYVTFTCAGLGFFQQAHWGVFTLDLDDPTARLKPAAQLYTLRDGLLLGDHAGQVVVDEANGHYFVFTSSWGDFDSDGVHVRHVVTSDDVLTGTHVLQTEPLALPTDVSCWDPAVTRIGDRWHIAFVQSPSQEPFDFHPALAAGQAGAGYDEGLELLGADTSLHQSEGPILQQVGGQWYLLTSDGAHRRYSVYDLTVTRLGALNAPYGSNIPHPQIFERPGRGLLLVTFDGTQYGEDIVGYGGHGDVIIMSSSTHGPRR